MEHYEGGRSFGSRYSIANVDQSLYFYMSRLLHALSRISISISLPWLCSRITNFQLKRIYWSPYPINEQRFFTGALVMSG
jgi:hypothetical protein